MEKINQISIKNFQSHKETIMNLSQGVNVIVGPSDSGKSAILRALRWIFFNKPTGNSFRSHWGGDTSAMVAIGDVCIKRYKKEDAQGYMIDDKNFEAIGKDIPEEVSNLINMSDVNCQRQLDPPFLLDGTPGEVAQYLNKIAHLDAIDISESNLARSMRNCSSQIKADNNKIAELESDLSTLYGDLDAIEKLIQEAENSQKRLDHLEENREQIAKLLGEHLLSRRKLQSYKPISDLWPKVEKAIELSSSIRNMTEEGKNLDALLDSYSDAEQESGKSIAVSKGIDSVEKAIDMLNKIGSLREQASDLSEHTNLLKSVNDEIIETSEIAKSLGSKFKACMPKICPLCGAEND